MEAYGRNKITLKIAMIMLAAGNSRRFGGNKLLYEVDGMPMYRHILDLLMEVENEVKNILKQKIINQQNHQ